MRRFLVFFLCAGVVFAQRPLPKPKAPPPAMPISRPQWNIGFPSGTWDAPSETWLEDIVNIIKQRTVWKHFKVEYPEIQGRVLYFSVQNMTHPIHHWDDEQKQFVNDFTHDPRNVILLRTSLEFDAVAGDSIYWAVWAQ